MLCQFSVMKLSNRWRRQTMSNDIVIIGAGPAGIATALQLTRYEIDALVLEAHKIGGLLHNASKVENYLGFPQGIPGPDLVTIFSEQLANHQIKIMHAKVNKLTISANNFTISTDAKTHKANIVVIATGTVPKIPDILQSLNPATEKKIFYEVAKMPEVKNKNIAIIGSGDAAFDYAVTLAKKNQVSIFNRREEIRALPVLQKYVRNMNNINYTDNANLINITNKRKDLRLKFEIQDQTKEYNYDYLLVAIGRKPCKDFYSTKLAAKENELVANKKLYLVGDIKNGIYRQASLAVADGIKTAMKISDDFRRKINENSK